jgi:hypothetical protein
MKEQAVLDISSETDCDNIATFDVQHAHYWTSLRQDVESQLAQSDRRSQNEKDKKGRNQKERKKRRKTWNKTEIA